MFDRRKRLQAFTLVEVLVYVAAVSMFVLLVFDFLYAIQKRVDFWGKGCSSRVQFELAVDILRRDLMSASMNLDDWDLSLNVFKKRTLDKSGSCISRDVCWFVRKSRLIRREGGYNYCLKKWKGKVDSTVAYNVDGLKIDVTLDKRNSAIKGVCFKVSKSTATSSKNNFDTEYLLLRNRFLKERGKSEE